MTVRHGNARPRAGGACSRPGRWRWRRWGGLAAAAEENREPSPNAGNPLHPSTTVTPDDRSGLPPALRVRGARITDDAGREVWLQGVCVDSMQWNAGGENIFRRLEVAIDEWKANVIRLPVTEEFWAGRDRWQNDNGFGYRRRIDEIIALVAGRGAYLVLDLHRYHAPTAVHLEFWKDVAVRYRNHPAVLFELFNEPHSLSWKVWRDGGSLSGRDNQSHDRGLAENTARAADDRCVGMQALLDAVRAAGADNPVIAGGLDWSYDLSGVADGKFALRDDATGRGVIYSAHVYPWKFDWERNFVCALGKHPVFIGEVGNIRAWEDFPFIPAASRREKVGVGSQWPLDMLGLIQSRGIHWTGFSFHPQCGPQLLKDWNYTPTDFWGVHVKAALAGGRFAMKAMR